MSLPLEGKRNYPIEYWDRYGQMVKILGCGAKNKRIAKVLNDCGFGFITYGFDVVYKGRYIEYRDGMKLGQFTHDNWGTFEVPENFYNYDIARLYDIIDIDDWNEYPNCGSQSVSANDIPLLKMRYL